jgi:CubicO group peptidase (beta-lactamase class C family)
MIHKKSLRIAIAVLVALAPIVGMSGGEAGLHATPEIAGVWMARRDFGPEVRGTLDFYFEGSEGSAEIAGFSASPIIEGDQLRFQIPGDQGAFLASLDSDDLAQLDEIRGHWIQPPNAANGNRFASPVVLTRLQHGHWRGEVKPLPDRMTFFLSLERNDNGIVTGFLRNPEANFGRHFKIERVVYRDGELVFEEKGQSEPRLRGPFDTDRMTFTLSIPDAGGTFDFRRLDDAAASAFQPRPGKSGAYRYRPPVPSWGGWEAASLDEVGIDVGTIERMIQEILAIPPSTIEAPYFHAILMARHGKLVLEEYFHGFTAEAAHDTRSAAKTVTSTLVGLALHNEAPIDLDSRVYEVMLGSELPKDLDPRKGRMMLRHLLTMTPGLSCDDNDSDSPGAEWVMQSQPTDWTGYTLALPMKHEPGSHVAYCSASTNLAGAVLAKATGSWLPELFYTHFARPLGIDRYYWNLMPGGDGYGGGGLYITGRDFLKMAQLFLDNGVWKERRLLSEEWVRDALSPGAEMFGQGYGYAWWILQIPVGDRTVEAVYAGGNGGQYSMAIPELDLALVFFGGNYNQRATHEVKREQLPKFILKAVELGEWEPRLGPRQR